MTAQKSRLEVSHATLSWREQDSNPRSPGRERRSRFGEREPGKGHGDDKRLSRDSEYLEAGRHGAPRSAASVRLSAEGDDADMRRRRPEAEIVGDGNERGQIGKISAAHC